MKRIYSLLLATIIISFLNSNAKAQTTSQPIENNKTITINMTGTETIKADQLIFNIQVNAQGNTPSEAYALHKEREQLLSTLLLKFKIEDKDINYQPIQMNRQYINRENSYQTATRQSVSVTFSDFSVYEEIQLTLIENGFDSFNGQFTSSGISEARKMALRNAVSLARERAEMISDVAGVKLSDILEINYSENNAQSSTMMRADEMMSMASESSGMLDFEKTIVVRAGVSITYLLQ